MNEFNPQDVIEALGETALVPKNRAYNKFQVSKMFGDGYQFVLRTDTIEELVEAMRKAKPVLAELERPKQVAQTAVPQPQANSLTSICPIHNVEMEEKNGQYGPYFSHRVAEGWCNGRRIKPAT